MHTQYREYIFSIIRHPQIIIFIYNLLHNVHLQSNIKRKETLICSMLVPLLISLKSYISKRKKRTVRTVLFILSNNNAASYHKLCNPFLYKSANLNHLFLDKSNMLFNDIRTKYISFLSKSFSSNSHLSEFSHS